MASIELLNITKVYDKKVKAVNDISLKILDQEFLIIVGPSGCGKSTLLRMIAGLEDITYGKLFIGNTLSNAIPAKNRDIAMVFQSYALYPTLSVYDNIAFGLKARKFEAKEIDRRVRETAKILGLSNFLNRKPLTLSGGQRQRVALGRAIVRNPKVFLLDEPLSNLDAKLRTQMRSEIKKLQENLKVTMIYVTHDQIEAMTMADRIVVLNNGKIMQVGTPKEIYENPNNVFVATFFGTPSTNIIKVSVKNNRINELNVNVDSKYNNKTLLVGIRPENVHICNSVGSYKIDFIDLNGHVQNVHVNVNDTPFIIQTSIEENFCINDSISITCEKSNLLFFDLDTKERI